MFILRQICPVGVDLLHVDRRADRHKEDNSCVSQLLRKHLEENVKIGQETATNDWKSNFEAYILM
jgi:hypothetical protein